MAVLTNAQILTAIANETTNQSLKTFITSHTNLDSFATTIVNDEFEIEKNALLKTIVNGIAKRIVNTKIMENKLKELKTGKVPYGSQIEEIISNPAKATPYVMNSSDLLSQTPPDIKSVYYKVNREDKYPVTISDVQLQRALLNEGSGLSDLINMCIGSLYSGDNLDEMKYTKQLISNAVLSNKVKKVILGTTTELSTITDPKSIMTIGKVEFSDTATKNEKMKAFVEKARELYYNFGFGRSDYNGYLSVKSVDEDDLVTACDEGDQVILLRTDILSSVDVELLATAFNMGKTEFLQKVIPVDDFNGLNVWGIMCDRKWFRIQDTYYGIKEFQNGSNLTANYWLHHHQIISYNLLANAVVFLDSKDKTLHNV